MALDGYFAAEAAAWWADRPTRAQPPHSKGAGRPAHPDRVDRGRRNHLAGMAAEDSVARLYLDRGCQLLERRWRGPRGELDLIFAHGPDLYVVEVKRGATHALAAEHLGRDQLRRIFTSAEDYLFTCHLPCRSGPGFGDLRIELALVDGQGRIETFEAGFFL